MFWNNPNLYSVAFKDIPNVQTPFLGAMPRFFNPYQMTPSFFAPPIPPTYFTPPVTPFMHTPPATPFVNPMMTPYNFALPYFQGYRPFGL